MQHRISHSAQRTGEGYVFRMDSLPTLGLFLVGYFAFDPLRVAARSSFQKGARVFR